MYKFTGFYTNLKLCFTKNIHFTDFTAAIRICFLRATQAQDPSIYLSLGVRFDKILMVFYGVPNTFSYNIKIDVCSF